MTAESGIILGVGVALVLFILVRRMDRRRHEQKLKTLQDKIARSEQAAAARQQGDDNSKRD